MDLNQAANAGLYSAANDSYSPAANMMPYGMPNVGPQLMSNAPLAASKYPTAVGSEMAAILVLFILLVIVSRMGHEYLKKC
jgi:hypothetical protein